MSIPELRFQQPTKGAPPRRTRTTVAENLRLGTSTILSAERAPLPSKVLRIVLERVGRRSGRTQVQASAAVASRSVARSTSTWRSRASWRQRCGRLENGWPARIFRARSTSSSPGVSSISGVPRLLRILTECNRTPGIWGARAATRLPATPTTVFPVTGAGVARPPTLEVGRGRRVPSCT
jgi:hypothetical protein